MAGKQDYQVTAVSRACDILAAFSTAGEVLVLRDIAQRTGLSKATAFRLLATLVEKGLLERAGQHGYRTRFHPLECRQYRIGYAEQSRVVPYIQAVTQSLRLAAQEAGVGLVILNNNASRKAALRNAAALVRERVDLVVEFQLIAEIAPAVARMFSAARIPLIAVDNPHPGAIYFGADSYRAGYMGGRHLGQWVARNWNGCLDELVLIQAGIGGPILEARLTGVLHGFDGVLGVGCAVRRYRHETRGRYNITLDVMRRHLRQSGARRIAVVGVNDPSALGALAAFHEAGREDHCAILGQDCVSEAREEMRRPGTRLIGSVAYFPETYGTRLMSLALRVLRGAPVPPAVLTRHRMVSPANVDRVYPNDRLLKMNGSYADRG